jgi:glycosyltransferase involved in cell wall biosynthesis
MKISVIMPVYLGAYPNSAKNSSHKFMRAVQSFMDQEFTDAELIIIADGCSKAESVYNLYFSEIPNIHFKRIEKQVPFSGIVRQTGIGMAKGDIICYLDADDIIGKKHLLIINEFFDLSLYDWAFYDDHVIMDEQFNFATRNVSIAYACIGTSTIAHKRSVNVVWGDGYGHDWRLIETYLANRPGIKIPTPQYYVCHLPTGLDF